MQESSMLEDIRQSAFVLDGTTGQFDPLLGLIGEASIVLLGEATHGTHEFYRARAEITQRLILEKGFNAIAVEADWPDALLVSRYIHAAPDGQEIDEPLAGFKRFPRWMWRNREMLDFVHWLRDHNAKQGSLERRVGFYGLDLYSLHSSIESVIGYLSQVDPEAARQARARYSCFDHLAEDPQRYGYATTFGTKKDCEDEAIQQLIALYTESQSYIRNDGLSAADELFYAQQNARVVQNAEEYYRTMFYGRTESWNKRDTHMAETLDALRDHLAPRSGGIAKIVVWAHNSHIGDARATEMGESGQLNIGQLAREKYGSNTALIGFTTHTGFVTAASDWDAPAEHKRVLPGRPDSYERLFHHAGLGNFILPLERLANLPGWKDTRALERAIGVIYHPETERFSHYFYSDICRQFDIVVHYDTTRALHPLDASPKWSRDEVPETYPSGL